MVTTMVSELFHSLPRRTQRKIDSVFDSACNKFIATSKSEEISAGGFIPEPRSFVRDGGEDGFIGGFIREEDTDGGFLRDEPSDLGNGGFLNDDDYEQKSTVHTRMPLSLVPSALQHLDLPPDDDEVLAVFRNAATGWTSSNDNTSIANQNSGEKEQFVSRDDWRSVCAVLLEHDAEAGVEMAESEIKFGDAADSDEYQESEAEEAEDDDDDYIEGPSTSTVRRRARRKEKSRSSSSPDNQPHKLTSRQRQTCIDAYSLFFPTAPAKELLNQRIMIKDLQRVANLLHEKLKAGDVSHFACYSDFHQ